MQLGWLVVAGLIACVSSYTLELKPNEKFCLFEQIKRGETFLVGYQVQDGPDFVVDFWLTDPRQQMVKHVEKQAGHEISLEKPAPEDGRYSYCFWNKATEEPSKLISFYTWKDEPGKNGQAADDDKTSPLNKELQSFKDGVRAMKADQEYIVIRERVHRDTAESTNTRVLMWSLVQIGMVLGVCSFQIWYLTQFFEVKRVV
jgi:p24 family protein beta-1